jgi:hypothetical protein
MLFTDIASDCRNAAFYSHCGANRVKFARTL